MTRMEGRSHMNGLKRKEEVHENRMEALKRNKGSIKWTGRVETKGTMSERKGSAKRKGRSNEPR